MIAPATTTSEAEGAGRLGPPPCDRGPDDLPARVLGLQAWIGDEMASVAAGIAAVRREASGVHRSAHHLLGLTGKHVRPMCVALAAKLGTGFGPEAIDLAVAVELVHDATLLHDDVIDAGDRRRGSAAARIAYGNARSVLSGDWLLLEVLKRVRRTDRPEVLDRMLDTIGEMIAAEMLQLANRGRLNSDRGDYFRVIEGKTATLFRWALFCGARAGDLSYERCRALEAYGAHLGASFQLVDDLLDLTGDATVMGKGLFGDLREGKMTYPLILAIERDRWLRPVVEEILSRPPDDPIPEALAARVLRALIDTGGGRDCLALARRRVADAVACLTVIPEGPGREALVTVAEATLRRDK